VVDIFINADMERLVLSGLAHLREADNEDLISAIDLIHEDCFTSFSRKELFLKMVQLHVSGQPISPADLLMHVSDNELIYALSECLETIGSYNSLMHWIEQLNQCRIARKSIEVLSNTLKLFESETTHDKRNEIINALPEKISKINDLDLYADRAVMSSEDAIKWFREEKKKGRSVLSTGIKALDAKLDGGIELGQLMVIGAPPSSGKTHMSLKLLYEMHKNLFGHQAVIFSLEAGTQAVIERLITHMASKPYRDMFPAEQYNYEELLSKSNISICDRSRVSVDYIRSYCKRSLMKNKISVVLVDYLDLVEKPKGEDRTDEKLALIANQLAAIAKDFNCVVILTTQLSKEAIRRSSRRPEMSDSKNSNGAAEASSYWIGLKRICRWDKVKKYPDSELVELVIDKVRGIGETGVVWVRQHLEAYHEIDQGLAEQLVDQSNLQRQEDSDPKTLAAKVFKTNLF
jgi:replicative DNA helicase